ncbi:scavenger receptor cysteine-rich type 1 protein M130-like [Polymixia lowei]
MDQIVMLLILLWSPGRVEVKTKQSWASVCEADFDQQDAEVVCRELGCGAPSVLQGALYGEVEAPFWTKEFQCEGDESLLLDCGTSNSTRNTCSPGKAVGLTCSGRVEVKTKQSWASVCEADFDQQDAEVVCRELGCRAPSVLQGALYGEVEAPFWTKEFQCEEPDDVRLVGGASRCAGRLEMKHQGDWRLLNDWDWNLKSAVRLVNGTSLCSGRVEVKTKQSWASVCEADFDQQDAEVVCRELGCGAPSVLQGALYGEVEAPFWTKEFQCEGDESLLLDCGTSGSTRNTCSPGKAVGLTCSEPDDVRLVGGASRCAGRLEGKHQGDWRPLSNWDWYLKSAAGTRLCSGRVEVKTKQSWASVCEADFDQQDAEVVCRELGCGAPSVLQGALYGEVEAPFWTKEFQCEGDESLLLDCGTSGSTRNTCSPGKAVGLTCSEPDDVRLVGGASRCAGRLEVKHQRDWRPVNYWCSGRVEVKTKQSWASVCEADFDQQDAEVVCRELGCGAPSVLQGALYGEVEAPFWTKEFQCEGDESLLLDCGTSGSTRNTCSPGKAVGLTCSEPDDVRLVGGASHCAGRLEVKHQGDWRPVDYWNLKADLLRVEVKTKQSWASVCEADFDQQDAEVVCRELGCGAPSVLQGALYGEVEAPFWTKEFQCEGRVEVKTKQSWASVCEADFDQQDAEVVCRELGCGAPSVLQGALYGEVEAPFWTKEFQCEGDESLLLDCGTSGSTRNTCSPGKAVGLTCSDAAHVLKASLAAV